MTPENATEIPGFVRQGINLASQQLGAKAIFLHRRVLRTA